MKNNSERSSSQITFVNQPRVHILDTAEDQAFLLNVSDAIRRLISGSQEFSHHNVRVKFFHSGVTSVVCSITDNGNKTVLKVPAHANRGTGEGHFLKSWEDIGIAVPHVIAQGEILDRPYTLMSYIDAEPLNKAFSGRDILANGLFDEMGRTLRRLHTVTGRGYGRFQNGSGQYQDFATWLERYVQWHISYVREKGLLNENEYGSIEAACGVLSEFVRGDDRTVYCHDDLSVCNLLNTRPLTVFDPNPNVNHPYLDLAKSVILIAKAEIDIMEPAKRLIHGYLGSDPPIDPIVLRSCILLEAYLKFPFWDQTDQRPEINLVRQFLRR
jgi:fructosamine-3-kinase